MILLRRLLLAALPLLCASTGWAQTTPGTTGGRVAAPPGTVGSRRPEVEFASAGQAALEGGAAALVEVRVRPGWLQPITVPYSLSGAAVAGVDYLVDLPSPLVFAPRERSLTLTVTLLDDASREAVEDLVLTLGKPVGARLGAQATHTISISDDDAIVPDDFNHCEGLVAPWTFVDPVGDATLAVVGVGTADAWATVSVPAGADHLPGGTFLPARVTQPAADVDLDLAVRIDSELDADLQRQGLVLEESTSDWLALDVHRVGSSVQVALTSTVAGVSTPVLDAPIAASAPYYLRVARVADDWTCSWSDDGAAWNALAPLQQPLGLTAVSLYAANAGGAAAPAHTAAFDWLDDVALPLVTEDGPFAGSGPYFLTTDVVGDGAVVRDPDQPDYTCSDVVQLTAVPNPGWVFDGWAGDATGTDNPTAVAMGADRAVTALFHADPPPVISSVAVDPGQTTAWVTWDTDEPATSLVEFGPDANYGSSVSDPALTTAHAVLLTGLVPAATYHFRVCSTDQTGGTSCSADGTFQTLSASGLVSDDFNHCEGLLAPWTYLDPIGDGSHRVTGVGTDDAWLQLAVPAGSNHVPFGSVLPGRVVQPVADVDFQYEVKFDSNLTAVTQLQGTTIEESASDWLRFDLYRGAGGLFAFVASTTGGTTTTVANVAVAVAAPMYVRVTRAADDWTFEWSDDPLGGWNVAAVLNRPMVAAQVSLYAGNSGGTGAPAHVASVDWFQDTSVPLATEDGPFPGSGPYTLTLQTTGSGTVLADPDQPDYTCSDVVTLTAVAGVGWDFDHWEDDLGGTVNPEQITLAADRLVTAVFVQDVTPPVISNVLVVPTSDGALVTWDTDEPATSRIDYGPDGAYGSFVEDPALVLAHALQVTGLPPDTLQHFMLTSVDDGGQSASTPDGTFQTLASWTAISDDFNVCGGVGAHWTFHDPVGDAGVPFVQGAGTSDAQLVMSVPGGFSHEMFGTLGAPYLVQTVNDVDFGLEVKFDSTVTIPFQIQGVLVKQDDQRWLRADFYRGTNNVRLFVGSTTAGTTTTIGDFNLGQLTAPMWLAVDRVGDQWWVRWSADGLSWSTVVSGVTQALTVAEAGVYVGNALGASAPPQTMLVDYFFDASEPIANEDGNFNGGGPFTLTTAVDPPGTGTITLDPDKPQYDCSDVVTLTAAAAPGFMFDSWSGDLAGTANPETLEMSTDRSVTAHFVPDVDPPVLSNLVVTTTATTATVSWTTDEPADGLVEYGLDSNYTDQVYSGTLEQQHQLTLTGLLPETTYHYQVTTADAGGLPTSTGDLTLVTQPEGILVSDDFRQPNLDLATWQWIDPLAGDGALPEKHAQLRITGSGTSDARLEIDIPAGVEYLPWITNGAARISQVVPDADCVLELKVETAFDTAGQTLGFFLEEDAGRWLRFDFYHTGTQLRATRATFQGGGFANFVQTTVQGGAWGGGPLWMRVQRIGDSWQQSWSSDGVNWVANGAAFTFAATLTSAGVMAGNDTPDLAGLAAVVDYCFDVSSPIVPEDGAPAADVASPFLYLAGGRPASDSAVRIQWATDEESTSTVAWGLTAGVYDQGTVNGNPLVQFDEALVSGLLPDTTYHFQVSSVDAQGNPATLGPDVAVTTPPAGSTGLPTFEIWYGQPDGFGDNVQRFGHIGTGQQWVNVLGNVQDSIGEVVALSYTLNGGAAQPLGIGQGGFTTPYRLVGEGDFNVELPAASLQDDSVGPNEVWITATDDDGFSTSTRVWVEYDADGVWPETYSVDWSTVTDLQDAVQMVDGYFEIDPTSGYGGTPALRNSRLGVGQPGYDRLFCLGDAAWDDYEYEFTITVHALNPDGYYPITNSHAVGTICRWPGHSGGTQQPQEDFFPFGGLFAFRWFDPGVLERWNAYGTGYNPNILWPNGFNAVEVGLTYVFKGQCETQMNGDTVYRMKSWEVGSPEPPDFFGEMTTVAGNGTSTGSLLILLHEVDASIGNITITPLN